MSIGSSSMGGVGGYNLASTVAGAQSNVAHADRNRAEQAAQKFQVEQKQFAMGEQNHDGDTTLSADRDPDGRLISLPERRQKGQAEEDDEETAPKHRGGDALGERGQSLDLDA